MQILDWGRTLIIGWYLLAGAFAAIGGAFRVSEILLLPLLMHEIGCRGIRRSLFGRLVSGTGGVLALVLVFTPVRSLLPSMWSDFRGRKSGDISRLFDESPLHALWDSLSGNPLLLAIGSGGDNVYLWTWDWHYSGRKPGWHYYKSFYPEDMSDPKFRSLLRGMDWLIVAQSSSNRPTDSAWVGLGFIKKPRQVGNASPSIALTRRGYGIYLIYKK